MTKTKRPRRSREVARGVIDGEPEVAPEAETCAVCDGSLNLLGVLGNTAHYRCRNCGIETYRRAQ